MNITDLIKNNSSIHLCTYNITDYFKSVVDSNYVEVSTVTTDANKFIRVSRTEDSLAFIDILTVIDIDVAFMPLEEFVSTYEDYLQIRWVEEPSTGIHIPIIVDIRKRYE